MYTLALRDYPPDEPYNSFLRWCLAGIPLSGPGHVGRLLANSLSSAPYRSARLRTVAVGPAAIELLDVDRFRCHRAAAQRDGVCNWPCRQLGKGDGVNVVDRSGGARCFVPDA